MRGNMVQGRWKIELEHQSINEGMVDELRAPVGTVVDWWMWDQAYLDANPGDVMDDIYDVSNATIGSGRRWKAPFQMPVIMAQLLRSTNVENERGFYVSDTLRLVMSVADVERLLPLIESDPNTHIKDRIVFQDEVFVPTRVLPRGRYAGNYSVVTVDLNQVNSEQLANDSQFQIYAL